MIDLLRDADLKIDMGTKANTKYIHTTSTIITRKICEFCESKEKREPCEATKGLVRGASCQQPIPKQFRPNNVKAVGSIKRYWLRKKYSTICTLTSNRMLKRKRVGIFTRHKIKPKSTFMNSSLLIKPL